jgi:L-asparaginase
MELLEVDEEFNAGFGSAVQADGIIRLTASYMDSQLRRFSGVINCEGRLHPSQIAISLQTDEYRVLASPGNQLVGQRLGMPIVDLMKPSRLKAYFQAKQEGDACDTVGCVVWHPEKGLAAGTSTGGVGYETPGRVSDAATVAGTYCSDFAAVSATGKGEQIVDDAFAARLETRVRDGMSLQAAANRCFQEALAKKSSYGWISLDRAANWNVSHTTPSMIFVVLDISGNILASS